MRHACFIFVLALAAGPVLSVAVAAGDEILLPATLAATGPADDQLSSFVEGIRTAPDVSASVEAYAQGHAVAGDDPTLLEAYVRRVVDFGMPQMAGAQAETLVQRRPDSGLAWAVVADARARRGEMTAALSAIANAVRYAPDDVFVQRTAGSLVAWYDLQANQSQMPAELRRTVAEIRAKLSGRQAYAEAYRAARVAAGSRDATTPVPAAEAPPQYTGPSVVYVEPGYVYGGDYGYDYYVAPPLITYGACYRPWPRPVGTFVDVDVFHRRSFVDVDAFHRDFDGRRHRSFAPGEVLRPAGRGVRPLGRLGSELGPRRGGFVGSRTSGSAFGAGMIGGQPRFAPRVSSAPRVSPAPRASLPRAAPRPPVVQRVSTPRSSFSPGALPRAAVSPAPARAAYAPRGRGMQSRR